MAKTLDAAGVKRLIQEIKGANKNLNTPIPISTENTPESMAQNVKNIADYVEKAKAAGISDVGGMAVTCIINNDYSGVGYLYGDTSICGIETDNGLDAPSFFVVDPDGTYGENSVLINGLSGQITSDMLDEGARNPIILTESTTEVDAETYQKLEEMADATDVVFRTNSFEFMPLIAKDIGNELRLIFGYTLCDASNLSVQNSTCSYVVITVETAFPYKVTIDKSQASLETILNTSGYLTKSILSPVLQEIDLTGTDAERKAKLDQFETDWKALTGASDLTGARFVGQITTPKGAYASVLFTYNIGISKFTGVTNLDDSDYRNHYSVYLDTDGVLTITPLFSHLEAITIRTGNTPEDKAANVAAIKAYVDNLIALGVDVTKGYMIPCKFPNSVAGVLSAVSNSLIVAITTNGRGELNCYEVYIGGDNPGAVYTIGGFQLKISSALTTTDKSIVPAINEVNAFAKGYSTIFTPIELTAETAQNKTAIDARVAAFTAQGISLANGCCIPVTYKGVYAGNINLINGDWYGLLVKNTNNPADNINIKLSADGTITEGNSAQ